MHPCVSDGQVSSVKEAIVGPDRLPAGLPGDITPHIVKSTLAKNSAVLGSDKDADAALKTCIKMASIFDYDVKVCLQRGLICRGNAINSAFRTYLLIDSM